MTLKANAIMLLPALLCDTWLHQRSVGHFRCGFKVIAWLMWSHDNLSDVGGYDGGKFGISAWLWLSDASDIFNASLASL